MSWRVIIPAPRGRRTARHPEGPPLWLNSNHREHWAPKGKKTAAWRERAAWFARAAKLPHFSGQVQVVAWCRWPRASRRDPGNWYPTAKAALDGLTDLGVWDDDDAKHVLGPDMREWPQRGPDALILEIVPVDAGVSTVPTPLGTMRP